MRETRGLALVVAGALALSVAVITLGTLTSQTMIASLAGIAALAWLVAWWHSRPKYGCKRGLPPGSLSIRDSLDAIVDRGFYRQGFERYGPVFKMAQFRRPVVCVLGLERGREILRRYGDQLALPPLPLSSAVPKGFLRYMSPTDYAVYSPLFRHALSDAVLAGVRAGAVTDARSACSRLERTASVAPAPADVIEDYVMTCLLRAFFGSMLFPGDRVAIDAFSRDADHVGSVGRPTRGAIAALDGFSELIRSRAADPFGPLHPSLWSELVGTAPDASTDPTVIGNLFLLLEASRGSISGLLTWSALFLAEEPEWLDAVRAARGEAVEPLDPATAAVLETLRLAQSEYVYRSVEEPIGVDGFVIPAGWLLRICVAESHLLDPPFVDPLRFDPGRHVRSRTARSEFSPFGLDAHSCLGARLTLELGRCLVEAFADYVPTVEASERPSRGNRHWRHWGVGPDFRLLLTPRE